MRSVIRTLILSLVCALGVPLNAVAQEEGSGEGLSDAIGADDSFDIIDENVDDLSGEEMLERAQKEVADMRAVLEAADGQLSEARANEKDILKVNCINEKLAAIKGFVKVSEESYVSLKESVETNDREGMTHHYTLVAVAGQNVRGLGEEAQLCTGEEQRYVGESLVEVDEPQSAIGLQQSEATESWVVPETDDTVANQLPELTPFQ